MGVSVLTITFGRWAELAAQQPHLSRGGLFVPPPDPLPEPFAELEVVVVAPDGTTVRVPARVVQIAPQAGVALACQAPPASLLALVARATQAQEQAAGAVTTCCWGEPAEGPRDTVETAEQTEPDGEASPHDRIRGLSAPEKMRLARHGDRGERLVLLKDPNKTIQLHLIQNKRITIDEIRYLASYRQANPEVLARIAETREWLQHTAVLTALVNNPKTPSRVAIRLLRSVNQSELRRLAKSPHTPRAVAIAARKLLAGGAR